MSKEIEQLDCIECESSFKLVYDRTETSGHAKFCPFCGNPLEEHEDINDEENEEN